MKKYMLLLLFLTEILIGRAQPGNSKTAVFKVRAPQAECTIVTSEDFFWLEKDNTIRVKTKGRNLKIKVVVRGGKIKSQDGENYTLFFVQSGEAVISVYKSGIKGNELLLTKKYEIKSPVFYFCGIATDSTSKRIDMRGDNLYAYSELFKQKMKIKSFDMYFMEDTNKVNRNRFKPLELKSDTCMLTPEMRKFLLRFQPHYNYIFFYNIICEVPDGSKRILDPINLRVIEDTLAKERYKLIYGISRKE